MVSKEVQGKDGVSVDYSDIDFKFHIEKVNSSEDEFTYDLYENNKVIEQNRKTKDHGHFTLRHKMCIRDRLIGEKEVDDRIEEIGKQISKAYEGKCVHMICVLKGSVFFACELAKRITVPVTLDFMSVSSYGDDTKDVYKRQV